MSDTRETVFTCDSCGAKSITPDPSWLFLTQPAQAFCNKCRRYREVIRYGEDYFLRGQELGISGYTDYRWLPDLTIPMALRIAEHCKFRYPQKVLDFGCARGYLVKALRHLYYNAYGVDVSEWAVRNADEEVKPYLNWTGNSPPLRREEFDWVIAKDVLEHVQCAELTVACLMDTAKVGVFAVVPLGYENNEIYVVTEYEEDVTHVHRKPLKWWASLFMRQGWAVEARYRLRGVKDNYAQYPLGNGFITARRIGD